MAYGSVPTVSGIFHGIKPAVIAIVLFAAYRIGSKTLKNPLLWAIAIFAFIAIFVFKLPFPLIVLLAGVIGLIGGYVVPAYFQIGAGHAITKKGLWFGID